HSRRPLAQRLPCRRRDRHRIDVDIPPIPNPDHTLEMVPAVPALTQSRFAAAQKSPLLDHCEDSLMGPGDLADRTVCD
ncbi:MAG: hypothetical protein O7F76_12890, partial [Planctomycetota bacterium]|nr:hypothetical protein [Planctomycetota bacterium]